MLIDTVDPRDIEWEDAHPVYRVYFWYQPPAPPGVQQPEVMYHAAEYRLLEATDIHEVIAWAEDSSGRNRTYTLYVEHRGNEHLGLIQLAGTDSTVPG